MNSKGSRVQITQQDFTDIMREKFSRNGPDPGDSRGSGSSKGTQWDKLISGTAEHFHFRPGLTLAVAHFHLHQEIEISSGFDQTTFASILTVEGSWRRTLKGRRGRTCEYSCGPGLNLAAVRPPYLYKLRMKGGESHRVVRLEITDPLLSSLAAGAAPGTVAMSESMLKPNWSTEPLIRRNISPAFECVAHQILHNRMQTEARRLFMEAKALEVLALQMEAISETECTEKRGVDAAERERLEYARSILEEEFLDPPSLLGLARRVGLNDFKLKRGFREIFRTSVFGYVRRLRMDKARSLLEKGEMNVTEAALEAGYRSFGHFSAAFKKQFGILPSQCRPRVRTRSSFHK